MTICKTTDDQRRVSWSELLKIITENLNCSEKDATSAIESWLESGDIFREVSPNTPKEKGVFVICKI